MKNRSSEEAYNPWKRYPESAYQYPLSDDDRYYFEHLAKKRPRFTQLQNNVYLDLNTKRAALLTSPSLVALLSYSGEEELSQGCGTIFENEGDNKAIVISSANLIRRSTKEHVAENIIADNLEVIVHAYDGGSYKGELVAYDFHYNIVAIRIEPRHPLPAAKVRVINDALSLNPSAAEKKPFHLRPHSASLSPGDRVIALGRYFAKPFNLMAAPGCFSLDHCEYECKELLMVTCNTTRCGDGGPLINLAGEVIGITYYDLGCFSVVLPINIACKWWDHYKKCRENRRLSLGFEATNFYAANLDMAERVLRSFPSISEGVLVEKVNPGSSAHSAGLCQDDVIVQCGGRTVESFFQLFDIMWEKIGERTELSVARVDHPDLLRLNMAVNQVTPDQINSWPRRDYR